jgi:hypothetical protein
MNASGLLEKFKSDIIVDEFRASLLKIVSLNDKFCHNLFNLLTSNFYYIFLFPWFFGVKRHLNSIGYKWHQYCFII